MDANSLKIDLRFSLLPCPKMHFHIDPLSWLIPSVLSSGLYDTWCTVYSLQCNVFAVFSLFV